MSLDAYIQRLTFAIREIDASAVETLESSMRSIIESAGTIILFGNGGSLANALHIGGDYQKTFAPVGARFAVVGSNVCSLTAACNDISFEESYLTLGKPHLDAAGEKVAIFLSGSGNSLNLIRCVEYCVKNSIKTVSISAYGGGKLASLCDIVLATEMRDMEVAEDVQMIIFHHIKQRLAESFLCEDSSLPKYRLRTVSNQVF